jgi:hypothetical protein
MARRLQAVDAHRVNNAGAAQHDRTFIVFFIRHLRAVDCPMEETTWENLQDDAHKAEEPVFRHLDQTEQPELRTIQGIARYLKIAPQTVGGRPWDAKAKDLLAASCTHHTYLLTPAAQFSTTVSGGMSAAAGSTFAFIRNRPSRVTAYNARD